MERRLPFRRVGRAAELTYDGKYAFGAWGYTTRLNDLSQVDSAGNPMKRNATFALYALAVQMVYHERDDHKQGLTVYTHVGMTNPRVNRFENLRSGGFVYTGLIPGSNRDHPGFGVATSWSNTHFETGSRNSGQPVTSTTVPLEWTYATHMGPTLSGSLMFNSSSTRDPIRRSGTPLKRASGSRFKRTGLNNFHVIRGSVRENRSHCSPMKMGEFS